MALGCDAPDSWSLMVVVLGPDSHPGSEQSEKEPTIDDTVVDQGDEGGQSERALVEARL